MRWSYMISIDLIWQNVCANYITVRGPKYIKNFQYFSSVHSYKTNFADIRNYFIQGFLRNYGKKLFVSEWLCSGKKLNRVWKPCHMSHSANSKGIVSYQIMNSFFFAWPFLAISLFVTVFVFFRSVIISCACLLSVVLFAHCFLALRLLLCVWALWHCAWFKKTLGRLNWTTFGFYRCPGCKLLLATFASTLLCCIAKNKFT